jgi:trehalose-phosphatase
MLSRIPIAIISGRELQDLRTRVDIEGILYAGNHGAEIWDGRNIIRQTVPSTGGPVQTFCATARTALASIPGARVEDKGATASIHYRAVHARQLGTFLKVVSGLERAYGDSFRITSGKKVFEIRPRDAWHKGDATSWILERFGSGTVPVYLGDDTTDEDAFRSLRGRGISVSVGASDEAQFVLHDQGEVVTFLERLVEWLEGDNGGSPA